jgi:hypothetical protein
METLGSQLAAADRQAQASGRVEQELEELKARRDVELQRALALATAVQRCASTEDDGGDSFADDSLLCVPCISPLSHLLVLT